MPEILVDIFSLISYSFIMIVVHYISESGKDFYQDWVDTLRDTRAKIAILRRIDRVGQGNFGDCKTVRDGVSEMRVDFGPGYRIYFFQHGKALIVLLGGGNKSTQKADIDRAISYKNDFIRQLKENK